MTREKPLIVQSDYTILLEVDSPLFEEVRDHLLTFAELVKSPEHIHTYRISPISLWNAASGGIDDVFILATLERYGRYEIPQNIRSFIIQQIGRYGRLKLLRADEGLLLTSEDTLLIEEIANLRKAKPHIIGQVDERNLLVKEMSRGLIKQILIHLGHPVEDTAGYIDGAPLSFSLRETALSGEPFLLRDYQQSAMRAFYAEGATTGGSGVVVLPCGAGKTILGMGIMEKVASWTLIVVTNITAARQWIDELLDKTTLTEDEVAEYSGERKAIKPVTIATYQILTWRKDKTSGFPHFTLFDKKEWGLVLYDEVHLLPAPIFRITAQIQAKRRLGLTATLIREDGREGDVFSLIGPKKYDIAWRRLEKAGWIAIASCYEVRVPMPKSERLSYVTSEVRTKFRIASENPEKLPLIKTIIGRHPQAQILVIGLYLSQLRKVAKMLGVPLIQGSMPTTEREKIYDAFRRGIQRIIVVSKVANFAVDLPDANVAIQISGTFGSRQEEAQRLGRILRPKKGENMAYFYTLVSEETSEEEFSKKRQLFLTEQGYQYFVITPDRVLDGGLGSPRVD